MTTPTPKPPDLAYALGAAVHLLDIAMNGPDEALSATVAAHQGALLAAIVVEASQVLDRAISGDAPGSPND